MVGILEVVEGRRLRILLVDDEPDILMLLQAMLRAGHWEVVGKASEGAAALRIAADIDPDVAIVDYMMPGINGVEVAQQLKALVPGCRVVLFTAYEDAGRAARERGDVDHFLSKGRIDQLDALLRQIAEERPEG